jgi:hypothetical protein
MENEPLSPVPEPSKTPDLQQQIHSLQHLLVSTLVLLVIISGTLWMFLLRQVRNTNADLPSLRQAWTNAAVVYQRNDPLMAEAVKRFQDFGRTNADFANLLSKYGLKPGAPTNAPAAKKK